MMNESLSMKWQGWQVRDSSKSFRAWIQNQCRSEQGSRWREVALRVEWCGTETSSSAEKNGRALDDTCEGKERAYADNTERVELVGCMTMGRGGVRW